MAKKGISKIKGPEEIHLGETVYYEVSRIYDLNDTEKVDFANWKIYVRDKGSFRELLQKPGTPPKKGYKIPLTINNQKLVGKEILIEAYLYAPEKSAPPGLKVKVLPGKNKKIDRVELFMHDDTPIKENTVLKYGQSIKVKVYTQNMPGEKIKLSLYEDDVNGPGHSTKNDKNKVASITRNLNKDGFLWHEFKLPVEFSKIANALMDGSHDKIHEYYVVAETAQHKSVSKNTEVKNPDYIFTQTVSSSIDPNKIYGKEILIEEVVIKGKYKKQMGVDPMEKSGRSVVGVSEQPAPNVNNQVCYCNRDFTKEEFKNIFEKLRDSEAAVKRDSGYTIFGADNCNLNKEDKSIEKLRLEINSLFKKYDINSCIRKIHFLAQIYHETDRLRTTLEYATNKAYEPYFGRGLMQLTHDSNYKVYEYYSSTKCFTNYKIIEENLHYACDSAGWFWKQGKVLSASERWKGSSDSPDYVKVHKPNYPKKIYSYKDGDKTIKYGAVDLGIIADDDKVDLISYLVNGGSNGLQERRNYVLTLKFIFNYLQNCKNKKQPIEQQSENNDVKLHFTGKTAKEDALSDKTKKILREVGNASENNHIYITSTARTPYDQARIMYDNCKSNLQEQRRTYKASGQRVIDVYLNNSNKDRNAVIKLMENKINELGPSTVSKHLANPEILNTFDVDFGKLTNKTMFWNGMKKRPELDDILNENGCYHIQIQQK